MEKAELWAYTVSLLPLINACDASLASSMRLWFNISGTPMAYSSASVVQRLQNIYPCLGVKCADVGIVSALGVPLCSDVLATSAPTAAVTCPSTDNSGLIAAIVILVVIECALLYFYCFRKMVKGGKLYGNGEEGAYHSEMQAV